MLCTNCGQEIIEGAAFCTNCGTAVSVVETVEETVEQSIEETVDQVVETEVVVSSEEVVETEVAVSSGEAEEDVDVVETIVEDAVIDIDSDDAAEVTEEVDVYTAEAASSAAGSDHVRISGRRYPAYAQHTRTRAEQSVSQGVSTSPGLNPWMAAALYRLSR